MTSTDYWKRRAEEQILEAERQSSAHNKRLVGFYADTTNRLQSGLESFYARYATKEKITAAEAQRVLNPSERQSFDRASAFYLAEAKRLGFGKEHAAYLRRLSGQAYVSRQQALLAQTRQTVEGLFLTEQRELTGTLQGVYPDAFARAMQDLGQGLGLSGDFARMDTETVNRLLRQGWVGANYSSRIWTRKELLLSTLEEMIPRAFATGENSRVLGQQLADKLGVSRGAGERLARTEVNYAANQSARLAYQQLGVDRYEYLATLDRRTSEICAALDGEVFWVVDASPGGNYPPMHPNCRSTTIPYFPPDEFDGEYRRAARNKDGGYYTVSAKMKYPEWKTTPESGMMEKTLSAHEKRAVLTYIGSASYALNTALRTGTPLSNEQGDLLLSLDSALTKMPVYEGTVYRSISDFGIEDMDDFWAQYTPGAILSFPAYTSSATRIYDEGFPIQYVITSKRGRDLRTYNAKEHEILFQRNTQYRVIRVENNTIYMEEV